MRCPTVGEGFTPPVQLAIVLCPTGLVGEAHRASRADNTNTLQIPVCRSYSKTNYNLTPGFVHAKIQKGGGFVKKCYPGGKKKAFNITYDDGVLQDVRFVEMLNRYGLKGTFNLNSQLMRQEFSWTHPNGMEVKRLSLQAAQGLYDGHEIASHTCTHPYMQTLTDERLWHEMKADKDALEQAFGREVAGFAVPFDYYDERIAACARDCGFAYARMSTVSGSFAPCRDWFHWKTGVYHVEPNLTNFVSDFLHTQQELAVCQIVGHSYDLDAENLWGTMELICAAVSGCEDVWFCTNLELVEFLKNNT